MDDHKKRKMKKKRKMNLLDDDFDDEGILDEEGVFDIDSGGILEDDTELL